MDSRVAQLQRQVRASPGDSAAALALAHAYSRAGRVQEAWSGYHAAGVQAPPSVTARLGAAQREVLELLDPRAKVATRTAPWGWSWEDVGSWRARDPVPVLALNLAWCEVEPLLQRRLGELVSLTWLSLTGCVFEPELLDDLHRLPRLEHLELSYSRLQDEDLARLTRLHTLNGLLLANCARITSRGMRDVSKLSRLQRLDLDWTGVDDDGVALLGELPLARLSLLGCMEITDGGLARLEAIPSLEAVDLVFCQRVTHQGVAHLQAALPGLHIGR